MTSAKPGCSTRNPWRAPTSLSESRSARWRTSTKKGLSSCCLSRFSMFLTPSPSRRRPPCHLAHPDASRWTATLLTFTVRESWYKRFGRACKDKLSHSRRFFRDSEISRSRQLCLAHELPGSGPRMRCAARPGITACYRSSRFIIRKFSQGLAISRSSRMGTDACHGQAADPGDATVRGRASTRS